MTLETFLQILVGVSGVFSALVLLIPRLTEMVLSRAIAKSLERYKHELQILAESHKAALATALENHKSELARQRSSNERLDAQRDAASRDLKDSLKNYHSEAIAMLPEIAVSREQAYQVVASFLERILASKVGSIETIRAQLIVVDEVIEVFGGLDDPHYCSNVRRQIMILMTVLRSEIER